VNAKHFSLTLYNNDDTTIDDDDLTDLFIPFFSHSLKLDAGRPIHH